MEKLGIDRKLLRCVMKLYRNTKIKIKINHLIFEEIVTRKEVSQDYRIRTIFFIWHWRIQNKRAKYHVKKGKNR